MTECNILREDDGDMGLEIFRDWDCMISVSVSAKGGIAWAGRVGGEKAHGKGDTLPAFLFRVIDAATLAAAPQPVQPYEGPTLDQLAARPPMSEEVKEALEHAAIIANRQPGEAPNGATADMLVTLADEVKRLRGMTGPT